MGDLIINSIRQLIQMNLTNYLFKVISVSAQWDGDDAMNKMCSTGGTTAIACTDIEITVPSLLPGNEPPEIGCCGWVENTNGEGECKYQSAGHCSCNGEKDCGQGCEWRPWTTTTTTSTTSTTKKSRRLVKDDSDDDEEKIGFCVESGSSASGIFRLGFIAALVA